MNDMNMNILEREKFAKNLANMYRQEVAAGKNCEGTLREIMQILSDPSWKVRYALAEVLASEASTPPYIIDALASDQTNIAALVLSCSPVLCDADLMEHIHGARRHVALFIACRPELSERVSYKIASLGEEKACIALLKNPGANISRASFYKIVERFGDYPETREILIKDPRMPVESRHALLLKTADFLKKFPLMISVLGEKRAEYFMKESCLRASVRLIDKTKKEDWKPFVEQLRLSGLLTEGFIMRAATHGKTDFIGTILAMLSGMDKGQVRSYLKSGLDSTIKAVLTKAKLATRLHLPLMKAFEFWYQNSDFRRPVKDRNASQTILNSVENLTENEDLVALLRSLHFETQRRSFY